MIKASAKTEVKGDKEFDKFVQQMKKIKDGYVSIGVHEGAGHYTEGNHPPEVYQVALWNEFGTERSPSRSFIRSTMDENADKINQWREEMLENIAEKGWDIEKALDAMGFRIAQLIRNKIMSNVPPPNAPSTIAAKEAKGEPTVTLRATELLLRSITWEVHT